MGFGLTNHTVNAEGAPVDLSNVVIFLLSDDPDVSCVPVRHAVWIQRLRCSHED